MSSSKSIIMEYEDSLIGKRPELSTYFFKYSKETNMKEALAIIKYAVETYLGWSPYEMRDWLSVEILDILKLSHLLKYVKFPPELNPEKDMFFIAWKIYPYTIHLSKYDLILRVYQNLLERKIMKFPKEYFSGIEGIYRANICLKYMIENFVPFNSIEELYAYFASPASVSTLRDYKLLAICNDLFGTPMEFLHESLATNQRSDFLFNYYLFMTESKVVEPANIVLAPEDYVEDDE